MNARVGISIIDFSIKSLVFCDRKIDSMVKKIESLPSILNPLMTRKDSFIRFCSKLEEMLSIVFHTTPLKDAKKKKKIYRKQIYPFGRVHLYPVKKFLIIDSQRKF